MAWWWRAHWRWRAAPTRPRCRRTHFDALSIAARLEYEKKREIDKDVKLSDASKKRLKEIENQTGWQYRGNGRTYTLFLMHEKEVKQFVEREGFGMMRMRAGFQQLDVPPVGSIAFAPAPAKEPNVGPAVALPKEPAKPADGAAACRR